MDLGVTDTVLTAVCYQSASVEPASISKVCAFSELYFVSEESRAVNLW